MSPVLHDFLFLSRFCSAGIFWKLRKLPLGKGKKTAATQATAVRPRYFKKVYIELYSRWPASANNGEMKPWRIIELHESGERVNCIFSLAL